jgi:molybdenum cofactor biosynthesis enzyme MoaA
VLIEDFATERLENVNVSLDSADVHVTEQLAQMNAPDMAGVAKYRI